MNSFAFWTAPRITPLRKTRKRDCEQSSSPERISASSTPRLKARVAIVDSSSSVVMWVISAKFLTNPQASPSGVSDGQRIPNCEG